MNWDDHDALVANMVARSAAVYYCVTCLYPNSFGPVKNTRAEIWAPFNGDEGRPSPVCRSCYRKYWPHSKSIYPRGITPKAYDVVGVHVKWPPVKIQP